MLNKSRIIPLSALLVTISLIFISLILVIPGIKARILSSKLETDITPTPHISLVPTVVPSTLPGEEEILQTQPIPTTIAFAPRDKDVAGTNTDELTQAKESINQINQAIQTKNSNQLHNLLSNQLIDIFSAEAVAQAFSSLSDDTGLQINNEPQISGEWAKQQVHYTNEGKTNDYWVILHRENGSWKLFGIAVVK